MPEPVFGKGDLRLESATAFSLPPPLQHAKERSQGHRAHHHKINYIEFSSIDLIKTKAFYGTVFGWDFQDWGPDYVSFSAASGGIDGGFARADAAGKPAPLVVLYSANLKATEEAIVAVRGSITVPPFDFPGGRRFRFSDGAGNELAVWSE